MLKCDYFHVLDMCHEAVFYHNCFDKHPYNKLLLNVDLDIATFQYVDVQECRILALPRVWLSALWLFNVFNQWPSTRYIRICTVDNSRVILKLAYFWHPRPQILGGKSTFIVVIHQWWPTLCQITRARTIDKYDVTIPAPLVCATSQIH